MYMRETELYYVLNFAVTLPLHSTLKRCMSLARTFLHKIAICADSGCSQLKDYALCQKFYSLSRKQLSCKQCDTRIL